MRRSAVVRPCGHAAGVCRFVQRIGLDRSAGVTARWLPSAYRIRTQARQVCRAVGVDPWPVPTSTSCCTN
jgi:hypothetical protein